MASDVYFWNLQASLKAGYEVRLRRLLKACKIPEVVLNGDLTAVKIHFGEAGVTGFVSPLWVRPIVLFLRKLGARPFLTDTATLYVGNRGEAASHAMQAAQHGFDPLLLQAPVIIADGLRSQNQVDVPFSGRHFHQAHLAGDILAADSLLTVSHFKGHELSGIGGALKNLAMGCATRQGKMHQHGCLGPQVHVEKCKGCESCVQVCATHALALDGNRKIVFNPELCVGCGACFHACTKGCLTVDWKTDVALFVERMMEYAAAVVRSRKREGSCAHLSFVMQVTPQCDCAGYSDRPICPDIGVLASLDPVALDQACLDLVNQAECLHPSHLPADIRPGQDKFLAMHPHTPPGFGLDYAEQLGLGSRDYALRKI